MGKKEIIDIIRNSKPEMESRYGVNGLGCSAPVSRNSSGRKSDIDILVTFSRDIDLFDFWIFESTLKAGCTLRLIWLWSQLSNLPLESASWLRSNMSKVREMTDYLNDILTAIADIEDFTRGMSYETFAADKKTVNAVIRSLEVLGEATKRIPISFRQKASRHPMEQNERNAGCAHPRLHGR